MLRTAHADRVWVLGGIIAAALLTVLGWLFLISPQNAETDTLNQQAAVQRQRVDSLRHRLTELRQQNTKLASYEAKLAADRKALPRTPEFADLLREIQAAGAATNVEVNGLTAGTPTPTVAGAAKAYAVPMTLTAVGAGLDLERLLNQLQQLQPRAVLISAVNATTEGAAGSLAGTSSMNITLQVFTTLQGEDTKKPS
jgi:type IV pilus assembly protein PilO